MNLLFGIVTVWLITLLVSAIINLVTSIYGLNSSEGPIMSRQIPPELGPHYLRSAAYFLVPVANIIFAMVFLRETLEYYNR